VLDLTPEECRRDFERLCDGDVPLPRRCADCGVFDTLRIHGYKDRICHLNDRSLIRVCEVR
jgi:hypothetical protein